MNELINYLILLYFLKIQIIIIIVKVDFIPILYYN